jgi:asparagine synthase (glutamine-hydrolysing)
MEFSGIVSFGENSVLLPKEEQFNIKEDHLVFRRNSLDLFEEDNLVFNSEDLFISVEGYIINNRELYEKYNCTDLKALIQTLVEKKGADWIAEINGEISVIYYNKKSKEVFLYTNLTTTKPLFYYYENNKLIFGRRTFDVLDLLGKEDNLLLDEDHVRFFLRFGIYPQDKTMFKGLRKVVGGTYVKITQDKVEEHTYHKLTATPAYNKDYKTLLAELNEAFDQAVKNAIEKNLAANKKTLITLSGGLDSRMIVLSAHKQGYDFDTLTFAQKGSWDHIIAQELAKKINKKNIFIDLTNGTYLSEYEKLIDLNGGYVGFGGASQSYYSFKSIEKDLKQYGLVLTGQLGDAIVGCTYNPKGLESKPDIGDLRTGSQFHLDPLVPMLDKLNEGYENKELLNFYCGGCSGVSNGDISTNSLIQYHTPFLAKDFLELTSKIPVGLRVDRKLYNDWYEAYYLEFKDVFYYNNSYYKRGVMPTIFKSTYWERIKRKLTIRYYKKSCGLDESVDMYPINDWGDKNTEELRAKYKTYLTWFSPDLRHIMSKQFELESISSKINLFTVSYVVNKYMQQKSK